MEPTTRRPRLVVAIAVLLAATSWGGREGRAERAPRAAHVVLGRATIRGSIPRSLVKQVLEPHLAEIESCLALEGAPRVSVTPRMIFFAGGAVRFAGLSQGALRPFSLGCLTSAIEAASCASHPPGIDIVDQPMTLERP